VRAERPSSERGSDESGGRRPRLRHATDHDLDRLEHLLQALRAVPGLHERKRGYFSRGSRAFVHFHADDSTLYADVRLTDAFQRVQVTTHEEQATFLAQVHDALTSEWQP
jgi:hypothetical protein